MHCTRRAYLRSCVGGFVRFVVPLSAMCCFNPPMVAVPIQRGLTQGASCRLECGRGWLVSGVIYHSIILSELGRVGRAYRLRLDGVLCECHPISL